jgi:hypothetical protein
MRIPFGHELIGFHFCGGQEPYNKPDRDAKEFKPVLLLWIFLNSIELRSRYTIAAFRPGCDFLVDQSVTRSNSFDRYRLLETFRQSRAAKTKNKGARFHQKFVSTRKSVTLRSMDPQLSPPS